MTGSRMRQSRSYVELQTAVKAQSSLSKWQNTVYDINLVAYRSRHLIEHFHIHCLHKMLPIVTQNIRRAAGCAGKVWSIYRVLQIRRHDERTCTAKGVTLDCAS